MLYPVILVDEAAILNLKTGIYYGLDPVGARIWNLIQTPRQLKEILETLLNEYDVKKLMPTRFNRITKTTIAEKRTSNDKMRIEDLNENIN